MGDNITFRFRKKPYWVKLLASTTPDNRLTFLLPPWHPQKFSHDNSQLYLVLIMELQIDHLSSYHSPHKKMICFSNQAIYGPRQSKLYSLLIFSKILHLGIGIWKIFRPKCFYPPRMEKTYMLMNEYQASKHSLLTTDTCPCLQSREKSS